MLKGKYLTFSYDDGVRQDIRLIEIFKRYGMNGTFNINSGYLGNVGHIMHMGFDVCFDKIKPDEVKDVYSGFEVACHGVYHKDFRALEGQALCDEVCGDMQALEALTGEKVIGGAYPGGCYDAQTAQRLRGVGVQYCRTIAETGSFALPQDFNMWHPTCHDNDDRVFELAKKFIELETEEPAIFYIWGHSFELDKPDRDRWYNIEKLCDMLAGRADIKYVSNKEILFNDIV